MDGPKAYDDPNLDLDTKRRNFYESQSKHNPEFRKESQRFRQYLQVNTVAESVPNSYRNEALGSVSIRIF